MKIFNKNLVILVLTALFLPILIFAQNPGIPHQFYGTVDFADGLAPDGVLVEAKIDSQTVASCAVKDGKYGYNPVLCFVTDPENNRKDKDIDFFVNGIETGKTEVFENGSSERLDFSLSDVNTGTIEKTESDVITSTTVVIIPTTPTDSNPTVIKMGDSLSVSLTSSISTNALVEKIEKLGTDFFSGATAILSGNNLLNGYEIEISGENIDISVTMKYDDSGIDEDTIVPYKFDGTSWVPVEPFIIDKSANTITFNIASADTPYVVFGLPLASTPLSTPPPSGGGSPSGGGGGDTTAPVINDVDADVTRTSATITWKTNESSISWLSYGTSADYGKDVKKTGYRTSHSITLTNLSPGAVYHFQIKSKDSAGNISSYADKTFTTLSARIAGDTNDDGKVDKYDFALMMADWGKTGLNVPSDLNKDGIVNKYDFALLMVNWSL